VTVEAGNTVGTDGAPLHMYVLPVLTYAFSCQSGYGLNGSSPCS
jgi:hypothetical protein